MGYGSAGNGTYNLHAGLASVGEGSDFVIGFNGIGTFNQTGGTVDTTINNTWGGLWLGGGQPVGGGAGTGSYTINASEGDSVLTARSIAVGYSGSASFVQNGGTVTTTVGTTTTDPGSLSNGQLWIGSTGSTGVYTMTGGVLNVTGAFVVGNGGTGSFNQSGGVANVTGGGITGDGTLSCPADSSI